MSSLALQEVLSVLVELQIGDLDLGGVNADLGGGSVHLIAGDSLDVDDPLLSVDLRHLALLALEGATSHLHLIALDHGNGVDLEMIKRDESSRCTYPSEPCSEEKTSSDGGCEKEPRNEPYGKYGEKNRHKDYNHVRHTSFNFLQSSTPKTIKTRTKAWIDNHHHSSRYPQASFAATQRVHT